MKRRIMIIMCMVVVLTLSCFTTDVSAGPLQNFYESPIAYWGNESEGPVSIAWNSTAQTVSLLGGDASGNLSLGVPLDRRDVQQVGVFMSVINLSSTVRFELCSDGVASGQYADVNDTHVVFRDGTYGNLTDEVILDFYAFDSQARFWITAHNQTGLIKTFERWYGLAGNNWLNLTSTFYNGSLVLYYLSGDTDYTTVHLKPVWEKSGVYENYADSVNQSLVRMYTEDPTVGSYWVYYNTWLEHFAYARGEWQILYEYTGIGGPDFILSQNYTWYNLTGGLYCSVQFRMWDTVAYEGGDVNVIFYNQTTGNPTYVWTDGTSTLVNPSGDWIQGKAAVWRTQEDSVGIMYWDNSEYWNNDTNAGNETVWISDFTLPDFDCNVTFFYDFTSGAESAFYDLSFPYFEYRYWSPSGVVQPHFSTVWWTGSGGQMWDSAPFSSEEDGYTEDDPPLPWWLGPFKFIGDMIVLALSGLGAAVAGGLIALATGASALWVGILNMLSPNLGTDVFAGLTAGVTAIGSSVGAVGWFVTTCGDFVLAFVGWLDWVTWFLSQPNVQTLIVLALAALPLYKFSTDGFDGLASVLGLYATIVLAILKGFWVIGTTIVGLIGNFMPFT